MLAFTLFKSGILSLLWKSVYKPFSKLYCGGKLIKHLKELSSALKPGSLGLEQFRKKTMNSNLVFSIFNKTYVEHTALYPSSFQKSEKLYLTAFLKIKVPLTRRRNKIFNYTMYFNVKLFPYKTKGQWIVRDGLQTLLFVR